MTTNLIPLDTRDRRIMKEIQYIRNYKPKYKSISINYIDGNMYLDIKTEKGNGLHFDIPKDYPFIVPKLQVQTTDGSYSYKERLCNMSSNIYYFIKNPTHHFQMNTHPNIKQESLCLCCKSILCADNWSPVVMIYQILNEIEENNKTKQTIAYKLVLNQYCMIKNFSFDIIKPILDFL